MVQDLTPIAHGMQLPSASMYRPGWHVVHVAESEQTEQPNGQDWHKLLEFKKYSGTHAVQAVESKQFKQLVGHGRHALDVES